MPHARVKARHVLCRSRRPEANERAAPILDKHSSDIVTAFARTCTDDAWPPGVVRCMSDQDTKCLAPLSPQQHDHFGEALGKAMFPL